VSHAQHESPNSSPKKNPILTLSMRTTPKQIYSSYKVQLPPATSLALCLRSYLTSKPYDKKFSDNQLEYSPLSLEL
jgi:hypothetical protein